MIDANDLERMAKERPDEFFLKGSGVLKLIQAIRQLEAEAREVRRREIVRDMFKLTNHGSGPFKRIAPNDADNTDG